MKTAFDLKAAAWAESVYGLAQRWLCTDFDREYEQDAREMFRDRIRVAAAERGAWGVLLSLAGAIADMVRVSSEAQTPRQAGQSNHTKGLQMSSRLQDIRHAMRSVLSQPTMSATAIVILALGLGACAAMFSVVSGVLLRPLAYDEPNRLVAIDLRTDLDTRPLSRPEVAGMRTALRAISAVGGADYQEVYLTGGADPRWVVAARVSHDVFTALGVTPLMGRALLPTDDLDAQRPVVISHRLWTAEFGGDVSVVGRIADVDGTPHRIVGVMPASFQLPWDVNLETPSDVWVALPMSERDSRALRDLEVVARLADGATIDQVQAELAQLASALGTRFPDAYPKDRAWTFTARPLLEGLTTQHRLALMFLFAAAGCLLVLVTVNLASLVLSSRVMRAREFEVRAALGASRTNLITQLLAEGVLLGLGGGIVGLLLSGAFLAMLLPIVPAHIPRRDAISVGWDVVAFTVALATVIGLIIGTGSIWRRSFGRAGGSGGSHRSTGSKGLQRTLSTLVIVQVAVSVCLLAGAGLMARTLWRLSRVTPGFTTDRVLTMRVALPRTAYPDAESLERFFGSSVAQLQAIQGVEAAGAVRRLPLATRIGRWSLRISRDRPDSIQPDFQVVTPGYFETLRIPIVGGRSLTTDDRRNAPGVAVVNAAMASRYWPGQDPIGREIRMDGHPKNPWIIIVGVVGDTRHNSLATDPVPGVYLPFDQAVVSAGPFMETSAMNLVIRSRISAETLAPLVYSRLRDLDPAVPIGPARTMDEVMEKSTAEPRFLSRLLGVFSTIAVVLVWVGVHGVLMLAVRQRTAEIGIRVAVGAGPSQVRQLVLGRAFKLACVGTTVGVVATLAAGQTIAAFLFGVTPRDPLTIVAVVILVVGAAGAGSILPVRRALAIDPIAALQNH